MALETETFQIPVQTGHKLFSWIRFSCAIVIIHFFPQFMTLKLPVLIMPDDVLDPGVLPYEIPDQITVGFQLCPGQRSLTATDILHSDRTMIQSNDVPGKQRIGKLSEYHPIPVDQKVSGYIEITGGRYRRPLSRQQRRIHSIEGGFQSGYGRPVDNDHPGVD